MCNISINFLSYTLPLEFLLYMQPLKVRGPASRITTPWWNGLLRQLSVSTRGVLEGGTKLVSHQFGFVGVIQIQVGQFTQVSTGIPDQVEATENGRLMSPCIFKEANGSAAPNCSIWYDYNFCTSVSQGFATFPLVEIYHEDQRFYSHCKHSSIHFTVWVLCCLMPLIWGITIHHRHSWRRRFVGVEVKIHGTRTFR